MITKFPDFFSIEYFGSKFRFYLILGTIKYILMHTSMLKNIFFIENNRDLTNFESFFFVAHTRAATPW